MGCRLAAWDQPGTCKASSAWNRVKFAALVYRQARDATSRFISQSVLALAWVCSLEPGSSRTAERGKGIACSTTPGATTDGTKSAIGSTIHMMAPAGDRAPRAARGGTHDHSNAINLRIPPEPGALRFREF
jgi:hypothetical protein